MKWFLVLVSFFIVSCYSHAQFYAQRGFSYQCTSGSCGVMQQPINNVVQFTQNNVVQPLSHIVVQPVYELRQQLQQVMYCDRWGRRYIGYKLIYVYVKTN